MFKLSQVLEKKIDQGIAKLETSDISSAGYDRLLTNVITSISVYDKITYKPQPKQETKPQTEKEKEN